MAHHNHETILETLRDQLGTRIDGSERDGQEKMIRTLATHLNYSEEEAGRILEQLISHGDIRYLPDGAGKLDIDQNDTTLQGTSSSRVANGGLDVGATAPAIAGNINLDTDGFWVIGEEQRDDSMGVRKGQVRPRGT